MLYKLQKNLLKNSIIKRYGETNRPIFKSAALWDQDCEEVEKAKKKHAKGCFSTIIFFFQF